MTISRAHTAGRALDGTSGPGGELHGSSDVAGGELVGTSDSSDEPDGNGGRLNGKEREQEKEEQEEQEEQEQQQRGRQVALAQCRPARSWSASQAHLVPANPCWLASWHVITPILGATLAGAAIWAEEHWAAE